MEHTTRQGILTPGLSAPTLRGQLIQVRLLFLLININGGFIPCNHISLDLVLGVNAAMETFEWEQKLAALNDKPRDDRVLYTFGKHPVYLDIAQIAFDPPTPAQHSAPPPLCKTGTVGHFFARHGAFIKVPKPFGQTLHTSPPFPKWALPKNRRHFSIRGFPFWISSFVYK